LEYIIQIKYNFKCIAEVEGFPSKTLYHQLYLKGPPKVRFIEYILSENEKDITLICEVNIGFFLKSQYVENLE